MGMLESLLLPHRIVVMITQNNVDEKGVFRILDSDVYIFILWLLTFLPSFNSVIQGSPI